MRAKAFTAFLALGLACGLALPLRATDWPQGVPKSPAEPVTDLAGLFSQDEAQSMDTALRQQWQAGHFQLAVLSLPSLNGQPLEDLSIQIARTWGLGGKAESNGVLLLIAAQEHRIRIEVGSRLEGDLPDVVCRRIISDVMAPRMRRGDKDGALQAGVAAITAVLAPQDPLAVGADQAALQGTDAPGQQDGSGLGAALAGGTLLGLLLWIFGQPVFWVLLLVLISALLRGFGGGGPYGGGFGGGGFGGGGFGGGGFGGGGFGGGGGGFSGGGASGGW